MAVPVVSQAFHFVSTLTLRLMAFGSRKLPPLWPGSMTTTLPPSGLAAGSSAAGAGLEATPVPSARGLAACPVDAAVARAVACSAA